MERRTYWTLIIVTVLSSASCSKGTSGEHAERTEQAARSIAINRSSGSAAPKQANQSHDFQVAAVFLEVLQEAKQQTQLPILLPSELPVSNDNLVANLTAERD